MPRRDAEPIPSQDAEAPVLQPKAPSKDPSLGHSLLALYTLYALAVAQPLLSLLKGQAEFFVVRGLGTGGTIALAFALVLVPPLPAAIVRIAAQPMGLRVRRAADGLLLAMPVTALLLYAVIRPFHELLSGPWPVLAAGGAAAMLVWLYLRRAEVRLFVTYLSIALVAVPGSFLLGNPLLQASRDPGGPQASSAAPGEPASSSAPPAPAPAPSVGAPPVVFVLFDELSSQGLLAADDTVDAARFPHFAALAAMSSWYRQAAAVSASTETAVPAILSGRMPSPDQLPNLTDHPQNLFTLVQASYRVVADELVTELCPESCESSESIERGGLLLSVLPLAQDLAIVYLHLILPHPYVDRLPPIDTDWGHFGSSSGASAVYVSSFRSFLTALSATPQRTLYFHHSHLPHQPYENLPSGKNYILSAPMLRLGNVYYLGRIEYVYRRYLLQAQLVDRLVGELLERLRQQGMLENCLLIVTADHGPRYLRLDEVDGGEGISQAEWGYVPLFVKLPGQTQGEVVDAPASSLDILPTILEELGMLDQVQAALGAPLEGLPLDHLRDERTRLVFVGQQVRPLRPGLERERDLVLQWKLATFGEGSDPEALFHKASPRPDLLGTPFTVLPEPPANLRILLDGAEGPSQTVLYDPTSGEIPTLIRGAVFTGNDSTTQPPTLAIAVNGTIQATVNAFSYKPGHYRFAVLLPEGAVGAGENLLEVGCLR